MNKNVRRRITQAITQARRIHEYNKQKLNTGHIDKDIQVHDIAWKEILDVGFTTSRDKKTLYIPYRDFKSVYNSEKCLYNVYSPESLDPWDQFLY